MAWFMLGVYLKRISIMDKRTKLITAMTLLASAITFVVVFITLALAKTIPIYIALIVSAGVLVGDSIIAMFILTRPDKQ
jgi:hypothetical protein